MEGSIAVSGGRKYGALLAETSFIFIETNN